MKSTNGRGRAAPARVTAKKTSLAVERELQDRRPGIKAVAVKVAKFTIRKKEANLALGERIVELRVKLGFKRQKDFAAVLGVSRAAVGNWERGVGVSRASLDQICQEFNASFEWLARGIGEMIVGAHEKEFAKTTKRMKLLPPEEFATLNSYVLEMIDARLAKIEKEAGRKSSPTERRATTTRKA